MADVASVVRPTGSSTGSSTGSPTCPPTCLADGTELRLQSDSTLLGHVAGNFTIVAHIGSGGMGDVYRAISPTIGARVAVKVLPAAYATDERAIQRLVLEAQAANRIAHAGVVRVLDSGRLHDRCYIAMELLEGMTLAEAMQQGLPPTLVACQIVVDILAILGAAHSAGVVHRDIKPENIFLVAGSEVKLLDFGIARVLDGNNAARLTQVGELVGTPAYMAPEQIHGGTVDGRSDLYATAVLLHHLITGDYPFDNSTPFNALDGRLTGRPTPIARQRTDVSPALRDVIAVTLAKEPRLRFRDAATMRMAVLTAMTELIESTPAEDASTMLPLYEPFWARALRGDSWPSQARTGNISEHAFTQRTVTDPAMRAVARDTVVTPAFTAPAFTAPAARRWWLAVGASAIGLSAVAILFVALRQHSTESSVAPTSAPPPATAPTTKAAEMPTTIPPVDCGGMHQLPLECATLRHFTAQFRDCAGLHTATANLQTMVDEMITRMCKEATSAASAETAAMMASSCMMTLDSFRAMAKEANCAIAH